MVKTIGYAAKYSFSALKPFAIERNEPRENEVLIEILYCGVCHSDVHQVRNEWKNTVYPCMPGHEIVGRVIDRGSSVTKFKIDDLVGVGCMIDSCHQCDNCQKGHEQYCEKGFLATYNGNMRHPAKENLTFGGYSDKITVREDFVLKIPDNLDPAAAAPIMCAGITTYSPLRHWNIIKGTKVGIVGLGGLGHMAIKLACAMGAEVTLITTSPEKIGHAKKIGATQFIMSNEKKDMEAHANSFDFILSTIPESHDANPYIALLKTDGVLTVVGCILPLKLPLDLSKMVPDRKTLSTSLIGSVAETQEVLDFCSQHQITPDIKLISIDQVNEAFEEIDKGDVDFRYVIDMKTIKNKKENRLFKLLSL